MVDTRARDAHCATRNQQISVVVPAYNVAKTLGQCLEALLTQSLPRGRYEVIVVDDGSSDDTAANVRQCGAHLLSQLHQGPAAARNRGLRQAQGVIVLFTDADCLPTSTWIEQMIQPFANPEVIGVRGPIRRCRESS